MKVLVACEFSGTVRDAFLTRGHDAVSCDLLPSETPGPHIEGPLTDAILSAGWDLMIAHPPCTYLANSGVRWLYGGKGTVPDPVRWTEMESAARFFLWLLEAPISRVVVENPIMHGHAQRLIGVPHCGVEIQTVQPWWFGHPETKATQLWRSDSLPALVPTDIVDGRTPRVHFASPGPNRWKERSRTMPGLAAAMADQWGR